MKPVNKFISNMKAKHGVLENNDVVYKIGCKDCNKYYMGYTGMNLEKVR